MLKDEEIIEILNDYFPSYLSKEIYSYLDKNICVTCQEKEKIENLIECPVCRKYICVNCAITISYCEIYNPNNFHYSFFCSNSCWLSYENDK
jgi:hypothetical protein